jgi:hypothetical protein
LGVQPQVALRGGADAKRVAKRLGCRLVAGSMTTVLTDMPDVLVVDDPSPADAQRWLESGHRAGWATVAVRDQGIGRGTADLIVDGSSILDPSFARVSKATRRSLRGRRVLIALGGGEHVTRLASELVSAIRNQSSDASIRVAAGLCASGRPALPGASWVTRTNGLRGELERCDVAVVAGGITLYEACALGRATVAMPVVSGQRPAVRAAASRRAVLTPTRLGSRRFIEVGRHVAALLGSLSRRRSLEAAARRLVDGRGAFRVAAQIKKLAALKSRPTTSNDRSACGHAEARTRRSEPRHQRKFALGVGPQRR